LELIAETDDDSKVWAAWSSPEIASRGVEEKSWNVILIMLDTLRADRLGVYGYSRPTSPNLDAFAERSLRFAQVVSQSPWTRPSHRALFTALYPASTQGLDSHPLASILWRAGYRTTALTAGGYIHSKFGFDAGFDSYRVSDWLNDLGSVAPVLEEPRSHFLFLHTYEIHDPFTHEELATGMPSGRARPGFSNKLFRDIRPLTEEEVLYVNALYDSGVAFTDRRLGELFEVWERDGVFDSSIVIITSDHGEELWDHGGFRHGKKMYDHQLLVPLIVWLPPEMGSSLKAYSEGKVVQDQVRLIDLYPTVLDLLGISLEHQVQGRSLMPILEGRELPELDAYSEATITTVQLVSLRSPQYKFIQTVDGAGPQLFNLEMDEAETQNLADSSGDLLDLLRQRIRAIRSGERRPEDVIDPNELDPELREQLKALGYIQ
jgi:arylsulfatase A-like enzyme